MAKKFFRQKVHNKKRTITQIIIISVCVIGLITCFSLTYYFSHKLPKGAKVKLRDSVAIEINSELPEKTTFFSELEKIDKKNITVDFKKVNQKKVGEYPVTIKVHNRKYKTTLKIVDSYSPELTVKNVTINEGDSYKVSDFVEKCTDNSGEKCKVEFYTLALTQEGEKIDYSAYKDKGTYPIQIIAKDASDNQTAPQTAYLAIGEKVTNNQTKCKYGADQYATDKYTLAVTVSENGCAINPELEKDENMLKAVKALSDTETKKLQSEFQKLNINDDMDLKFNENPIPNIEGKGLIGYSLEVVLTNTKTNEVIEQYFVKNDGSRIYSINKYKLN